MTISELEQRIDLLSLVERSYKTKKVGVNLYRVEECPGCKSKKGFTIYTDTNSFHGYCSCYNGGGVYRYLMEVEGMEEDQAYQELLNLTGVAEKSADLSRQKDKHKNEDISNKEKSPITSQPTKAEVTEPLNDYTNTILELYNKQTDQDKEYFIKRGLTLETIDKHKLCIGDMRGYGGPRAIIPTFKDDKAVFYTGRALTPKQEDYMKYDNAPGSSFLFNSNILKGLDPGSKVIVTESQIDTLTLEQLGYNSVSIGGSGKANLLIETIKEIPGAEKLEYFTLFDNDDGGDKGRAKLQYKHLKVSELYNDVNEWYVAKGKEVKESIDNQFITFNNPDNLYNYMSKGLRADINAYKEFKDRKTGFKNLDEITRLYPGLYAIGGLSTLGKTTFTHQLCDQMAEQGEHILFFSLEMATLELATKSLARLTALENNNYLYDKGVNALDIRLNNLKGNQFDLVDNAIDNYKNISKRFNIIEGNFNTSIHTIKEYVKKYIQDNKVKPIVVIDYLQIMPGDEDSFNNKDKLDKTVTSLKQLSRDYNLAVMVISSFNRTNYLTPVDFESFSGSSGIEYSADVVWGLQLQAINDDIFNSQAKIKEKREIINKAKLEHPRKIELVCLKNRNGKSNYSCNFTYYSKYDLFISEKNVGEYKPPINSNARRL